MPRLERLFTKAQLRKRRSGIFYARFLKLVLQIQRISLNIFQFSTCLYSSNNDLKNGGLMLGCNLFSRGCICRWRLAICRHFNCICDQCESIFFIFIVPVFCSLIPLYRQRRNQPWKDSLASVIYLYNINFIFSYSIIMLFLRWRDGDCIPFFSKILVFLSLVVSWFHLYFISQEGKCKWK